MFLLGEATMVTFRGADGAWASKVETSVEGTSADAAVPAANAAPPFIRARRLIFLDDWVLGSSISFFTETPSSLSSFPDEHESTFGLRAAGIVDQPHHHDS